MSSSEDVPTNLHQYTGHIPQQVEPKSVYTTENGEIYHTVKLHGVYKDATGWHIKEGEPRTEFINYGDTWKGSSYYGKRGYTKKNKAHFMRIRAGVIKAISEEERLDFLTLTTQYDKEQPEKRLERIEGLNYAWTKLKQQIEYFWQRKLYLQFCRKNHLEPYEIHGRKKSRKYPEYWDMFRCKLKYFKVKTSEGGGVLHILFRKPRDYPPIPKEWLHKQWLRIWGSWNTSIHEVPVSDVYRICKYTVSQYIVNQPIIRISYGHQWVFLGFVKSFRKVVETYANMRQSPNTPEEHKPFKRAIEVWNKNIEKGCLPDSSRKRSILGSVGKDGRWHSRRYKTPKLGIVGVVGCDFDVWREKIHLKWWDVRIDSPKYVDGSPYSITVWLDK